MSVQTISTSLKTAVLSAGMMSMFLSFHEKPSQAVLCIVLAAALAGFDGYIEKKLRLANEFGKEFRSLAELITFGAAPSLIVYLVILYKMPVSGLLLAALFIICGALRLARFNISTCVNRYHTGLPIHVAGSILAVSALWSPLLYQREMTVILVIILCCLMVSRIKIPAISQTKSYP
ncbi:CDP-diacylglycerol--serine O-phosphatidyltransferase [Paenibacillus sp. N3.4]|uniref:CDP-diacylglycerol--serine O-phosphatidyltransferase n=1 Tax=Paenibacillus sp. N3.4 TaxID=2603222 RepID=UPI00164F5B11|nr:CDP-diacylglycerol--serine O-phosphatidyltransferase [Paenibacillus sp. N3.4]